jgi:serine/threonine protein kinase
MLRLCVGACVPKAALVYLHEAPTLVAHRDLNPDNLLVDGALTLRVSDFGLAERIKADGTSAGTRCWWLSCVPKLPSSPASSGFLSATEWLQRERAAGMA